MIFIFWELVGVCSYFLIGFWYEEKKNADAANKAFITNRVGDVGMLVGLGLLWTSLGTFDINEINRTLRDDTRRSSTRSSRADGLDASSSCTTRRRRRPWWTRRAAGRGRSRSGRWRVAGLGVFAGCVGKSAQFPLHVWLPDAMAGPTPVSALIHAATMVAAGVYLVGRFYPLFTDEVLLYIAYTGGITLFIAASIAMVQTDYKKVLAYSTVSQLGFMMLGPGRRRLGGGAVSPADARLLQGPPVPRRRQRVSRRPHLRDARARRPAAEDADHGLHDARRHAGDLGRAVLQRVLLQGRDPRRRAPPGSATSPEHVLLFVLPAVGAIMTAFYMFRMWFLVFDGEPRGYPAWARSRAMDTGMDMATTTPTTTRTRARRS